jgi:hypothetical protein
MFQSALQVAPVAEGDWAKLLGGLFWMVWWCSMCTWVDLLSQ